MPVTIALIAINILVFLLMVLRGISPLSPTGRQLLDWGALFSSALGGQWWRLVTSMFLHIGFIHLALNMWCLWNLGLLAESLLGRWTYLASYLATGVGAGLLSLALNPLRLSAGASGAVFGLAGLLITGLYFAKLAIPRSALQSTIRSLAFFAFYNLVIGFSIPAINNTAHLGGLGTGLIIGLAMAPILSRPKDQRAHGKLAVMTVTFLLLFGGLLAVRHINDYAVSFDRANDLLTNNDYAGALAELQRAAARKPGNSQVQEMLGYAYEMNNDRAHAMAAYERALQLDHNRRLASTRLRELKQAVP
jgi:rhomboid protease GluP